MRNAVPSAARRALEVSVDLAQLATSPPPIGVLLERLAETIRTGYRCEYVAVLLRDDGLTPELCAYSGNPSPFLGDTSSPLFRTTDDLVRQATQQRRAVVREVTHRPDGSPETAPGGAPVWRAVLPLTVEGLVIGALDIVTLQAGAVEDAALLGALASHAAMAIERARHHEGERKQRSLVGKLNAIGRTLTQTLDPQRVLDMTLEQLATIVPHDRGAIMLEEQNELAMRAARGFPAQARPLRIRVPIHEDDVYRTIRDTGRPLLIPDVSQRPDWQYLNDIPRAGSWLGVPLTVGNAVIGMLSLTREQSEVYTESEVELAATFAHQVSAALNDARLYEDLSNANMALEESLAQLRQRTHDLQVTYEQLRRLDQTKGDFIAVASHELRTPLTVLSGYSQMLASDPVLMADAYREQVIKGLLAGSERLNVIVEDMLDMARIDNQVLEIRPEPLFPAVLIKAIRPALRQILRDRNVTLELDRSLEALPLIEADTAGIRKVFHHLMVNAVKYTPDGGSIRIWAQKLSPRDTPSDKEAVEIVVSDTGIGIDPVVQELIFAKFYQTGTIASHSSGAERFKGGGPGLGLAIARGIVEAHGGRIWVESPGYDEERCPGSDFHVQLPIRPDVALALDP